MAEHRRAAGDALARVRQIPQGKGAADASAAAPDPAAGMDMAFVTVSAHATRRRAGRQWVAGEAVTFTLAEVDGLDLEALVADPGFTVTFTDPDDIPG